MSDTEKIVIELGSVRVDLSFDAENLPAYKVTVKEETPVTRSSFTLGVINYSRADFEKYRARNERVKVNVLGMFRLDKDISPTLAMDVLDSIRVVGVINARDDVKHALIHAGKIM